MKLRSSDLSVACCASACTPSSLISLWSTLSESSDRLPASARAPLSPRRLPPRSSSVSDVLPASTRAPRLSIMLFARLSLRSTVLFAKAPAPALPMPLRRTSSDVNVRLVASARAPSSPISLLYRLSETSGASASAWAPSRPIMFTLRSSDRIDRLAASAWAARSPIPQPIRLSETSDLLAASVRAPSTPISMPFRLSDLSGIAARCASPSAEMALPVQRPISRCSSVGGRAFSASSVSAPLKRTLLSAGYRLSWRNIAGSLMVRCVTTAREAFRSSRLTSRMARRGRAPARVAICCHSSGGSVCCSGAMAADRMFGAGRALADGPPHLKFARPPRSDEARETTERAEEGSQCPYGRFTPSQGVASVARGEADCSIPLPCPRLPVGMRDTIAVSVAYPCRARAWRNPAGRGGAGHEKTRQQANLPARPGNGLRPM
uniref:Uncharacterized protein n=1 Tax=Ralstonia solanacearum TaxID=305 RepID=A0A0S4U3C7_RALSL|nr:exported protein of unknown function [Ralstonia solanacearum]